MLRLTGATAVVRDARDPAGDTTELWVDGGRVVDAPEAGTAATAGAPEETFDVAGCVVAAGLVNAHHHLLQTGFRTLPGTRGVPMATWLPAMAGAYASAGMDPDLARITTLAAVAEGLLDGVTTVADHQLNWPADGDPTGIAVAGAGAARELGGRLVFVRGSARHDPDLVEASAEAIVAALGAHTADGMLQLAVGPAGVHSDGEATFRVLGEVAARHGLRRRTQANEEVDVAIAMERYGRRPLDLLEAWGWLAPDVTIAHLVAPTDDEIARVAASGATATHAPGCDVPMGWGVAPVAALRDAGIVVGLGTSGGGSNDAGHLLADARLALQVSALVGPQLAAREVLAMATTGSATGLGRPELGHLMPGAAADLCVWDVSGVADAGVADPIAGLLWASPGRRPRDVMVAGRWVVRDHELVTGDEHAIADALRRRVRAVVA